jgi:hypothetical protein
MTPTSSRTAPSPRPARTARIGRRSSQRRIPTLEPLESRLVLSTVWVQQGPSPTINGQDEGITSVQGANPVSGAIEAVAPSATDTNLIYVATVNGGVWKTTNATAATPTWTPLTDSASLAQAGQSPSLSFNSIAISPLNANVLFAGTGRVSSYGGDGGDQFGIAKSIDGGSTWTVSGPTGLDIRSIVPTTATVGGNQVIVAGTNGGVYRSTDGGATYALDTNGIPAGTVTDLVGDPGVATRLYAAISATGNIYISNDSGASWTLDNGSGYSPLANSRVLLSVHNDATNDDVYAMAINLSNGTLSNVFRSANQGGNWTALGVPAPPIFPGTQGGLHGAILADQTDPNSVWISGDRQNSPFPNVNGANNFSANVFQFTATGGWQNRVMNGANGTSPHADSRGMAYDPLGNIIQVNDGGIFRLNQPTSSARFWSSLNGTGLIPTEAHSAAFDPVSNIYFAGTQDTGTTIQTATGASTWNDVIQGDGGNVQVDADTTAHPGQSIRYIGFTGLPADRVTYNAANGLVSATALNFTITSGPNAGQTINATDPNIQFYNPYVLNRVAPTRMLIGTANIYESMDQGNTVANFGFTGNFIGDGLGNSPLTYGGRNGDGTLNPGSFYVGAGTTLFHRSQDGGSLVILSAYPGGTIRGLVSNPQNVAQIFVLDTNNRVWGSMDEGVTWLNLTASLPTLTDSVRSIEIFSPDATPRNTVLVVGGIGGVYQLRRPGSAGIDWQTVGTGLPKGVLVYDVTYNYTDNVLTIGTLGRGVWSLTNYFRGGGGTGVGGAFGGQGGVITPGGGTDVLDVPQQPPIAAPVQGLTAPINPDLPPPPGSAATGNFGVTVGTPGDGSFAPNTLDTTAVAPPVVIGLPAVAQLTLPGASPTPVAQSINDPTDPFGSSLLD